MEEIADSKMVGKKQAHDSVGMVDDIERERGKAAEHEKPGNDEGDFGEFFDNEAEVWLTEDTNYAEYGKIYHIWCENGEQKRKREGKTIKWFRTFLALDFGTKPKEQSGPENQHNEWRTRAGEK